jgi:hypothetical protein
MSCLATIDLMYFETCPRGYPPPVFASGWSGMLTTTSLSGVARALRRRDLSALPSLVLRALVGNVGEVSGVIVRVPVRL